MIRHTPWLFVCAFLSITGCTRTPAPTPPAQEKPRAESELAIATLPKEAVASLDIKTEKITQQDVDEYLTLTGWIMAKPALDHAAEEVEAAKEKLTFFQLHNITLKAPHAGKVLKLYVDAGQYVPVSAPLITIINLDPVWVRVPVPEVDLPRVDLKRGI